MRNGYFTLQLVNRETGLVYQEHTTTTTTSSNSSNTNTTTETKTYAEIQQQLHGVSSSYFVRLLSIRLVTTYFVCLLLIRFVTNIFCLIRTCRKMTHSLCFFAVYACRHSCLGGHRINKPKELSQRPWAEAYWTQADYVAPTCQTTLEDRKHRYFRYSPPISVDCVYFLVGSLDKSRHCHLFLSSYLNSGGFALQ